MPKYIVYVYDEDNVSNERTPRVIVD